MTTTPTPATLSVSVESEEYVLVPRTRALGHAVNLEQCAIFAADVGAPVAKAMTDAAADLRAALSPNPSPAAKSGEAVVIPYDDFYAAYRFVPRSKMSPDCCLKTRLRSLLRAEDLAYADEAEALATPSPQPADAVREAAQAVINSATNTYRKRNGQTGTIEGEDGEMSWIVPFDPFEQLRAALSVPSPAGEAMEPVAYAPKGRVSLYLKNGHGPCWVYGSRAGEDDEPLYDQATVAGILSDTARLREDLEQAKRDRDMFSDWFKAAREEKIAVERERDDARKALEEAATWHDAQDKAISKQPNANVGHNGWMRSEHQEQAKSLRAAARSASREATR